jgi:predicted  nucleic acid-binding Zn-ribbon protein
MKEGLMQLLKAQNVDRELKVLEEAKSRYPDEISQRQGEISRAENALTELTDRILELENQQRHLELELEVAREQLKKQEERFAEVTTNKEYDALQLEIEACKTRISEFETQILKIIEDTQTTGAQAEIEKGEVDSVRELQQSHIDELQEKLSSLQGEVDGVISQREAALKGIDEDLLRSYERSQGNRGRGVAAVRRGACGSCFRQLPAQQKSNARRSDQILHCESCGAILAWDDEST